MKRLRILGVAVAALAAMLATGGPAAAAPSAAARPPSALAAAGCVVPPYSISCSSSSVAAGSDGAVSFAVNTGIAACTVNVRDMTLNPTKQIYSRGFAGPFSDRITGLTNRYRVELRWCTPGSAASIW